MNDEIRLDQCHSEAQADRWVNRQADKWSRRLMIAAAIAWAFVLALVISEVVTQDGCPEINGYLTGERPADTLPTETPGDP
jgi:hypothetical protein